MPRSTALLAVGLRDVPTRMLVIVSLVEVTFVRETFVAFKFVLVVFVPVALVQLRPEKTRVPLA